MMYTYEGDVKDPYEFSKDLIDTLLKVYDECFGKKNNPNAINRIYENINFLNYLRDISMLHVCDIQSMSKHYKIAFFMNIKQCIWLHEYFLHKGNVPKAGLLEKLGLKKTKNRITYKIGRYEFNYEDIVHGIFRCNKPKPGRWFAQFSNNDPRNNIIGTFNEQKILAWFFDEIYENKIPPKPMTCSCDPDALQEMMANRFSAWVQENVKYDSFSNEIILPAFIKNYLVDFEGHELRLLKLLMQFYKSKYMKNEQVLSDYNDGNLFLSYEDTVKKDD